MVVFNIAFIDHRLIECGYKSRYGLAKAMGMLPQQLATHLKANQFSKIALTRLCQALDCEPGDLLCRQEEAVALQ